MENLDGVPYRFASYIFAPFLDMVFRLVIFYFLRFFYCISNNKYKHINR